jgi:hypothetical protein
MTNGAVAQQVEKVEGNSLQVKYKDGEKTIVVPKDAEVVNLVAGSKADLKTGAHVFIPRWEKQGDGTWQATIVVVGRDGIYAADVAQAWTTSEAPFEWTTAGSGIRHPSSLAVAHLNLKLSRLNWSTDRQPISFMSRSISARRFSSALSTPA